MNMSPADHAFSAFIASRTPDVFEGEELAMFRYYSRHPAGEFRPEVEAAIAAYKQGKRK